MIRKEAWLSCRTSSGVCLCWELEQPQGPKADLESGEAPFIQRMSQPRGATVESSRSLHGEALCDTTSLLHSVFEAVNINCCALTLILTPAPFAPPQYPALTSSTPASASRERERLVVYCQTTGVSAAHATYCATYCTPCRPLILAFFGWPLVMPHGERHAHIPYALYPSPVTLHSTTYTLHLAP